MATAKTHIPQHGQTISMVDLRKCIHCGLCTSACPTYLQLGSEADSPRGRIHLMRAVAEGRADWTPDVVQHLDLCLECRACETACPSGVPYGSLLQSARAEIEQIKTPRTLKERLIYGILRDRLFPYPHRLRVALAPLKWFGGMARKASRVLPKDVRRMVDLLPEIPRNTGALALPPVLQPVGDRKYRVALFTGCISSVLFARTNYLTAHVLAANGCEVVIPREQQCCGALHHHSGDPNTTRRMANHNLSVFDPDELDAIIINSAGCGSTLKEYGGLFENGTGTTTEERSKSFAAKTKDISEFLASIDLEPMTYEVNKRIAYHDACHLLHGQKIQGEPRRLLNRVPGVQLFDIQDSDVCCGSAGLYNILQPDMAESLLEDKVNAILDVNPDVLATGNPGCLMQIEKGLKDRGTHIPVVHPIEILAQGYGIQYPVSSRA